MCSEDRLAFGCLGAENFCERSKVSQSAQRSEQKLKLGSTFPRMGQGKLNIGSTCSIKWVSCWFKLQPKQVEHPAGWRNVSGDDDAMDTTMGSEIGRKHFEEASGGARRSVAASDLAKYDQFRKKFDPIYMNSSAGGSGVVINWPDDVGIGSAAAAADDDDDLYG